MIFLQLNHISEAGRARSRFFLRAVMRFQVAGAAIIELFKIREYRGGLSEYCRALPPTLFPASNFSSMPISDWNEIIIMLCAVADR